MKDIPSSLVADYEACQTLTFSHYENFSVLSLFVPSHLRPHFCSIYAYCRTVDDLGDEAQGDRLRALDAFENAFHACVQGNADEAMFRALHFTIERFHLPSEPFLRLIEANRRDQRQSTYRTFDDLRDYCRYSADPVGHLVLGLFGCLDEERAALSDYTCTALQVANHLQDIDRDLQNGRIYLPEEDLLAHGSSLEDVRSRRFTDALGACVKYEVDRTAAWFERGKALEKRVPRRFGMQLRLYRLGGEAILDAIRRQNYNPFAGRPTVSSRSKMKIAFSTLLRS